MRGDFYGEIFWNRSWDKAGLSRYTAKLKHALASKQDQITGTKGQVVGFGPDGKPAAQSMEDVGGPWLPLKGGTVTGALNRAGSHCYGKPGHQKICGRYRRENIIDSIRNDRHVVWRGKRDPIRLGAVQWPEQYAGSAQPVYCGRRGGVQCRGYRWK